MSIKVRTNTIPFNSGAKSPAQVMEIAHTLGRIVVRVTGELGVTVAATLREDGVLNVLQRVDMKKGSTTFKSIGDNSRFGAAAKIRNFFNQFEYGNLPVLNQPGVGVATNLFDFTFTIPMEAVPMLAKNYSEESRSLSMLSPSDADIVLDFFWGVVADVISAGTATLDNVEAEIIGVMFPEFDGAMMPLLMHETTQQVQLQAGANSADIQNLNRVGTVPYIFLLGVDNELRDDDNFNRVDFLMNVNTSLVETSWQALKAQAQEISGLQGTGFIPTGVNLVVFDDELNGRGALELDDTLNIRGLTLSTDHDTLTETFRLIAHHVHFQEQF